MGRYKEMWTGQWGWYNALMFSMMGLMMVFLILPENLKIWMAPGTIIYMLAFWGIQNKVILMKKDKIEGNRFIDARIVRDKGYSEDLLLGFANFQQLDLGNYDKNIEDLDFFKVIKNQVKNKILTEKMSIELEMQSTNGIFNPVSFANIEEKKKKENEPKDLVKVFSDELEELDKAEIQVNLDQQEVFKKFLKENSLFAYSGDLYEGVSFDDTSKHEFNTCIIVCRNELEKEFLFSKLTLLVEGYEISAQAAKADLITIAWIGSYCPIYLVAYTERHSINKLDSIITGNLAQTIKEKVMEQWIFAKKNFFARFEKDLRQKSVEAEENFKRWDNLVQDLEDQKIENIYEDPSEDSGIVKISKKLYVGLIITSCLAIVLLGALIGVVV